MKARSSSKGGSVCTRVTLPQLLSITARARRLGAGEQRERRTETGRPFGGGVAEKKVKEA